jgi:hypothetical protein
MAFFRPSSIGGTVGLPSAFIRAIRGQIPRLYLQRRVLSTIPAPMLHYHKFRLDLLDPQPAREIYVKHAGGRGWPEECPPLRAANGFGFDLLANFEIVFNQKRGGGWRVEPDITIESDFDYAATPDSEGKPLMQQYAWFWEKGQKLPHVISDDVFAQIRNQVKVSSFLFLKTDPNELLMMTDIPNLTRKFRAASAVIDTDWYPASYPWHCVLELDPREKKITISKNEPLARLIPLRRDTYFAAAMSPTAFDEFFARGQQWLTTHGQVQHEGIVDITHTYVKQQVKSKFIVMK